MITTKGRYAIRIMIDLAENNKNGLVALKDVAERQNISKKYLEIIVKLLVQAKLVLGHSGKGGGYTLTRAPEDYNLREIIEAAEGTLAPVSCLQKDAPLCDRKDMCKTLPLWQEYYQMIDNFFESKTLSELLKN